MGLMRHDKTIGTVALGIALALTAACGRIGGDTGADIDQRWAMLERYCTDCHNDAEYTADLSFEGLHPDQVGAHAELFEKVVRKLRGRVMPPPGERQPEDDELYGFVAALERALDATVSDERLTDQVVLHRLNRKEYANAIRDLLAIDIDPTTLLPQDDTYKGFDNIATALQVSPSFIEQYVIAARTVALQAVGRPDPRPGGATYEAEPGSQHTHVPGLPLGTRGGILAEHWFPADGEYVIDIANMAGHIWGNGMEFENTVVVTVDGHLVYETVVGGEEDMKLYDQVQDGAIDRVNERLKNIRFQAKAGPHKVGVAFKRRTFAESDDRLQMFVPGGGQDRMYRVSAFQIMGPFNPVGLSATPSRERIFSCHPEDGADPQLCAEEIITSIARRAYRRPIGETDLVELLEYYRDGVAAGGFEEGIRSAITGILASPYFLYRGEGIPAGLAAGTPYEIDDFELASKLSFFLWNSIPDDELLDLAADNRLSEPGTLDAEVARMLADPRSETLASNFVHQWLDMKRLDEVVPDRVVFPNASGAGDPRADFLTELTLFSKSIFDEDRSVLDLMTASHTYLNERIALHYGITTIKGDRFRRVELEDSARWGLLGKGAVLMAAAYPNRTSPVLRGAFILQHIQGTPPATPPANVPALDENDIGTTKALTVREMMAKHRASPACFSCHAVMDPLGFALENFDATGAWRDRDRFAGTVIDSTGELPDGTPIAGPDDLREALIRRPEQFVQTFTEQLMMYATGRALEYYDMPAVRRIVHDTAAENYRFSTIVRGVIASDQFRMRRVPRADQGTITAQNAADPL
jgi:Protein of unknown function (DUF1592)/Protein of unknown function (DUF1588)/Protein of unknown function (DUF1585)/Protein of unknown function (DUF1587)/Protein of unknown function (DUF1595)